MKQTLDRVSPFLPWLGLGLLAAGAVTLFVSRQTDVTSSLLLGGGALALLLFTLLRPDEVRRLLSGRRARYGLSTFLAILFFAAITIILYWVAYGNNQWRWDLTETQQFSPLPETVAVLEQLDQPVHVIGFYTVQLGTQQEEARQVLENLKAVNSQLSYEFQDPEVNPLLAEQYELNFNGTLVFTKGEAFARANSLSDSDIHAALLKVINPVEKVAYFLSGHGERGVEDFAPEGLNTAVSLIEDLGFTVSPLTLAISGTVPADATAIALLDQQAAMLPEEVEAIGSYLDGGGAVFIARDVVDSDGRASAEADGLNAMLQENWGITLRNDIVIEVTQALAGQQLGLNFVAADYGTSPIITPELQQGGLFTVFFLARSIASDSVADVSLVNLVLTSSSTWGETDFAALQQGQVNPDPDDALGPLTVAVTAENQATGGRMVVFGDVDFMTNEGLQGGNASLFTNSMNWLAGDEATIQLTPRETVARQVVIPQGQLGAMQMAGICLGPAIMGLAGVVVWYNRRKTR